MPNECNHDCSSCSSSDCKERVIEKIKPNANSSFKKTFAVVSGKGGVGKSLITSLLASAIAKKGKRVAIIDADVTGPSIPQAFGLAGKTADYDNSGLYPVSSNGGIKIMSANLLLESDEAPVIWRGPMLSSFVQQLYSDVNYGDIEYLLIDMPPGTADVPLTIYQMIPIDGIVVVSTPQDLVSMVVAKSINMAKMMNIEILGLVQNMSYIECPKCHERMDIFGGSDVYNKAKKLGIDTAIEMPIDPLLTKLVDQGNIENYSKAPLEELVQKLIK